MTAELKHDTSGRFSLLHYYFYSLALGFRAIIKGQLIPGLKRLLNPISYWRCVEVPWVVNSLKPQFDEYILDLGSPKLLSLYLAHKFGCKVFTVDILGDFILEYHGLIQAQGLSFLWKRRYFALQQNGRNLPYRDSCFDKIYSISVLEHIPDNGDTLAICELARVLKPGGLLAITVPYCSTYREYWVNRDVYERKQMQNEHIFYQRAYDQVTLEKRLLKPSGLSISNSAFYSGYDLWENVYMRLPLPLRGILAPFQPLAAKVMLKPIAQNEAKFDQYGQAFVLLCK